MRRRRRRGVDGNRPWALDSWPALARDPARELHGRELLVPALWSGSVEHFYHFLTGYMLPIALWRQGGGPPQATVRDCGPMRPWLELLKADIDLEVIPPGLMLQRLVRKDQQATVLAPLDDPRSFDGAAFRRLAEYGRRLARVDQTAILPATPATHVTLIDRRASDPFFASPTAEIPGSGAMRRSVPDINEGADALGTLGSVDVVDLADRSPQQQIAQMSATRMLVGQHGAGLANMVWMPPGGAVIEIQPPQGNDEAGIFRGLAAACGLRYAVVPQPHDHSEVDWRSVIHAAVQLPPSTQSA